MLSVVDFVALHDRCIQWSFQLMGWIQQYFRWRPGMMKMRNIHAQIPNRCSNEHFFWLLIITSKSIIIIITISLRCPFALPCPAPPCFLIFCFILISFVSFFIPTHIQKIYQKIEKNTLGEKTSFTLETVDFYVLLESTYVERKKEA
ncbi:hypothetical protein I7I53_08153 [Histoplasma capsulatum var. duboisii H88]|uniref:Uncharacterized protein n=1 Tax=Ajellomyces capsulatus (strain H88) TaxID=544711 RepID=A0A8A1LKX5_AJEC8|nr:hypothetical protein I7I53_08153 [Histoplasma capsulatum var. duboisii H88]